MKKILLAGSFLLGALSSTATFAKGPELKTVRIEFFSIGGGVDRSAISKVKSVLGDSLKDGSLYAYKAKRWGMEGELTLCARMNMASEAKHYEALEKIVKSAKHSRMKQVEEDFNSCGEIPFE